MSKAVGSFAPPIQLCGSMLILACIIYMFDPCCRRLRTAKETRRARSKLLADISHSTLSIDKIPHPNGKNRRMRTSDSIAQEALMDDNMEMETAYYGTCPTWAVDPENTARLAAQIVLQLQKYGKDVYTPEEMARIAAGIILSMSSQSERGVYARGRGPAVDMYDIPETAI